MKKFLRNLAQCDIKIYSGPKKILAVIGTLTVSLLKMHVKWTVLWKAFINLLRNFLPKLVFKSEFHGGLYHVFFLLFAVSLLGFGLYVSL